MLSAYEQMKAEVAGAPCVAERAGHTAEDLDEKIVQAIWHEQFLDGARLATCSGKQIRVIEPGEWNGEPGPDFRRAEIEIGGRRIRGDVEIHIESTGWEKHQHARDFEYNGVILHAFLRLTDNSRFDQLHNGSTAERLELLPFLNPDLDTICRSLSAEDYVSESPLASSCQQAAAQLDPDYLRSFLLAAGRERMESKIARFQAQRAGESLDQVMFQAVMTAMGYKGGKTLFFLLAKRTPIDELKVFLHEAPLSELHVAIESILLNVAGLAVIRGAEATCESAPADSETQQYLHRINGWWGQLFGYYQDRLIPPTRRWFGSVRPVNFPTRRIAGVSRMLANFDFRRGLANSFVRRIEDSQARQPKSSRDFRREIDSLATLFEAEGDSYWSTHYTLGGKPSPRHMQLIGAERASSVLFNALLPLGILFARENENARLEEYIWRLYDHFPLLPDNAVTRFMSRRLFGPAGVPPFAMKQERFNQGLFQIFHDCCNNHALTGEDCVLRPK